MKSIMLLISLALVSIQASGQGMYPLQKGNLWQYQSGDLTSPDRWESLITGDTILPNGKIYSQFTQTNFGTRFLRQEGSRVFGYGQSDSSEFVLFDFAATPGDTISRFQKGQQLSSIVLQGRDLHANYNRTVWTFLLIFGSGPGSYDFADWWITDSLGLTHMIGEPGITYNMTGARINEIIYGTVLDVQKQTTSFPDKSRLEQNYPNPFNPSTTIRYALPQRSHVTLTVFNTLGQQVASLVNGDEEAGYHDVRLDASGLASGMYFYHLTAGDYVKTKKLVILR
jgi:hypothetical protein